MGLAVLEINPEIAVSALGFDMIVGDGVLDIPFERERSMKKEFSETKTVISPDGRTVTTFTVSSSSETTANSTTVSSTVTSSNVTTTIKNGEK